MLYRTCILSLVALGATWAVQGAGRSDFSGEWTMDTERSESAHQEVAVTAAKISIRISGNDLTMETTRTEKGSPSDFHERLSFRLDGSETNGTGHAGVDVTGKARWNGDKLVVETVRNVNDATVTTHYVHSLSPDGKSMTVDKTLSVQHGYQGKTGVSTGHGTDIFVRAAK